VCRVIIIAEKSILETKVGNGKWEMRSKKVHGRTKLIFISDVGKGCLASRDPYCNGMVVVMMSAKAGIGYKSVGSSAGDQLTNSSLNRICGTAFEYYRGYTLPWMLSDLFAKGTHRLLQCPLFTI
jgi:hypothetical protein